MLLMRCACWSHCSSGLAGSRGFPLVSSLLRALVLQVQLAAVGAAAMVQVLARLSVGRGDGGVHPVYSAKPALQRWSPHCCGQYATGAGPARVRSLLSAASSPTVQTDIGPQLRRETLAEQHRGGCPDLTGCGGASQARWLRSRAPRGLGLERRTRHGFGAHNRRRAKPSDQSVLEFAWRNPPCSACGSGMRFGAPRPLVVPRVTLRSCPAARSCTAGFPGRPLVVC